MRTFTMYTIVIMRTESGVFEISSDFVQGNTIINDTARKNYISLSVLFLDILLIIIALIDIKHYRKNQ